MSAWLDTVKPGDVVIPDPLWNRTERPQRHLPPRVRVLRVVTPYYGQLSRGFVVELANGQRRILDAGWFIGRAA